MRAARTVTLFLVLVAFAACGQHEAPPRPHAAATTAASPSVDGVASPPSALPEPTPLAAELASQESLSACRARVHATIDPDLAELLGDLGYDSAPDDVCIALAAVRGGDPATCDALSVSAVRHGCRRRVAIAHALPTACPDDLVVPGREPVCLAWASRDLGLCRAASDADRPRCRAVLTNDATPCHDAVSSDACARDVRRFGPLLAAAGVRSAPTSAPAPTFTVTLRGRETLTADASATVARGVAVTTCGGRAYFTLGATGRESSPPQFVETPTPWLTVAALPGDDGRDEHIVLGGPAANASLVVVAPHAVGVSSELGALATVTHEPIRLERGAVLGGALQGTIPAASETLHVTGTFRTFVRDLLEQTPPCRR